jgi:SRSO17 transposase
MEGFIMPGIVEFPSVVRNALEQFGHLFENGPQQKHFAEYLCGLILARRKSVAGINREFADTTDQSCLNRFVTEASWDEQALNEARIDCTRKIRQPGFPNVALSPSMMC